jgi:hypothetical protein
MEHRTTFDELRCRIAEGRYEIDPVMVADAIIRHRSNLAAAKRAGIRDAEESRRRSVSRVRRFARRRSRGSGQLLAA